jgi:hypothetical protein
MEDEGKKVPVSSVRPLEAPGVAPLRYVSLKNPPSGSKRRDQRWVRGGGWVRIMQKRIEEIHRCFNNRDVVSPSHPSCLLYPLFLSFIKRTWKESKKLDDLLGRVVVDCFHEELRQWRKGVDEGVCGWVGGWCDG